MITFCTEVYIYLFPFQVHVPTNYVIQHDIVSYIKNSETRARGEGWPPGGSNVGAGVGAGVLETPTPMNPWSPPIAFQHFLVTDKEEVEENEEEEK